MTHIIEQHLVEVFFIYGLSFFSMGLAVLLEAEHSSELEFGKRLLPLGWFGIIHGSHEWFEMFLINQALISGTSIDNNFINYARVVVLAISFMMLLGFGVSLLSPKNQPRLTFITLGIITIIWAIGLTWLISHQPEGKNQIISADVFTRYALAIPGAALTSWGLLLQRRQLIAAGHKDFGHDVTYAAIAFLMYGSIGQLFVSPSTIFPSQYLNTQSFVNWFGFPIQVFRAAMACLSAVFIIRSLRAVKVENVRQITQLREEQMAESHRLEELRAELLHRTVKAQESERSRIARELHDETGQALTALGLGLKGLSDTILKDPQRASQQANQLVSLASTSINDLQRMVSGLHPPQLDDFGLLPALRWYAGEVKSRYGIDVSVSHTGGIEELPSDIRIVMFRIAQEAITNSVRHANANQVTILLNILDSMAIMEITDDGVGFNVDEKFKSNVYNKCWGLYGMIERATLVGGVCHIKSSIGNGTIIRAEIPVKKEKPQW